MKKSKSAFGLTSKCKITNIWEASKISQEPPKLDSQCGNLTLCGGDKLTFYFTAAWSFIRILFPSWHLLEKAINNWAIVMVYGNINYHLQLGSISSKYLIFCVCLYQPSAYIICSQVTMTYLYTSSCSIKRWVSLVYMMDRA